MLIKKLKYLILLNIAINKILVAEVSNKDVATLLVLSNKINNTKNSNLNKSKINNNFLESDLATEFEQWQELSDNTNITKAGGTVTTDSDFSAVNRIVKTSSTGVAVSDSGITVDGSNNISGLTSITMPTSNVNSPAIIFPGVATNSGIYSQGQDTIDICSQGANLIIFSPSGTEIPAGKTLTIDGTTTFNNSSEFNNASRFNASTTLNGTGNSIVGTAFLSGTTNITGQATLNGTTTSNTTTISGAVSIPNGGTANNPAIIFNNLTNTGIYATSNNVSISTDGAQRINFATGAVTIPSNNILTVPASTAAAPSIKFTGSTNTGLSAPTANTISFDANGSEIASISSSELSLAEQISMNNNNITGAGTINATGLNATGITASGANISSNLTMNSGSKLNLAQTTFSRIYSTAFTPTANSTVNLSTSSVSSNYDVFYINGNNINGVGLVVGTGFPTGTIKTIINGSTGGVSGVQFYPTGAFKNVVGQVTPVISLTGVYINCGHAATIICTDSTNGYWSPITM